jgi:hypothetical protein
MVRSAVAPTVTNVVTMSAGRRVAARSERVPTHGPSTITIAMAMEVAYPN